MTFSKIYVIGAGSIGSFFAAHIKNAGIDCTLVVRDEAHTSIENGIQIKDQDIRSELTPELIKVPVKKWSKVTEFESDSLILVCTKTLSLEVVLKQISEKIKDSTKNAPTIVLTQNGLGVYDYAQQHLPKTCKIGRAICWLGVRQELKVAEKTALLHIAGVDSIEYAFENKQKNVQTKADFQALLNACQLPGVSIDSIHAVEWRKGLWNVSMNGLCAIVCRENGASLNDPDLRPITDALFQEAVAVAKTQNIEVDEALKQKCFSGIETTAKNLNSTLMDIALGRKTEIEWLNGAVVKLGKEHGIPCPTHFTITQIIKSLESNPRSTP